MVVLTRRIFLMWRRIRRRRRTVFMHPGHVSDSEKCEKWVCLYDGTSCKENYHVLLFSFCPLCLLFCQHRFHNLAHFGNVLRNVEFSFAPGVIHVSNFPKHFPFSPSLVVQPRDRPGATDVPVWVPAIQFIFVVQMNRRAQCDFGRRGPFQNLFGPVHA